jgi:hypothetical protein
MFVGDYFKKVNVILLYPISRETGLSLISYWRSLLVRHDGFNLSLRGYPNTAFSRTENV